MESIKNIDGSLVNPKSHSLHRLTEQQTGLWFDYLLDPESNQYNTYICYEITGRLNENKFIDTVKNIIKACDSFRIRLVEKDGNIYQEVLDEEVLHYIDLSSMSMNVEALCEEARSILNKATLSPHNLKGERPTRVLFVKVSPEKFFFCASQHHIISDASSAFILCKRIAEYYNDNNLEGIQKNTQLGMSEYISLLDHDTIYAEENKIISISHWKKRCSTYHSEFDFQGHSFNERLPEVYSSPFEIGEDDYAKLKSFSRKNRTTPFLVLTALWAILLYRYWRHEKFVIGYPINIRPRGFQNALGFYTTMLPMCIEIESQLTILEFIQKITKTRSEDKVFENVTFPEIFKNTLNKEIRTSFAGFNVIISATAFKIDLKLEGLTVENVAISGGTPQHDLGLSVDLLSLKLESTITHSSIFEKKFIKSLVDNFKNLLATTLDAPQQLIQNVSFLSQYDRHKLLVEWNQSSMPYPKQSCIHELFEEQIKKNPHQIAIVFENQWITYEALNKKANQLAHYLRALGIETDTIVAISLSKSISLIVGLLAILKAGGAYVPLDCDYPEERLQFILNDTNSKILITEKRLEGYLSFFKHQKIFIDCPEMAECIGKENNENLYCITSPNHLAYVIYTSGSTGYPKGVLVNHQGVVNHNMYAISAYGLTVKDKVLQFSTPIFDLFVEEVFPTLLAGATLVIAKQERLLDIIQLKNIINEHQISVLNFPTAFWHKIVREGNLGKSIRLQILGGEKLDKTRYYEWIKYHSGVECINTYGPTETTIIALAYKLSANDTNDLLQSVPIGKPISNINAYIVDDAMQLMPAGLPGELLIGGVGLARGYLNQPELTQKQFIDNPFIPPKEMETSQYRRLYRTGDRVRYRMDGNIEFLGRIDNQVKIRGFRVELGEIEAALNRCPEVQQATVAIQNDAIVAYVLPHTTNKLEKNTSTLVHLKGERIDALVENVRHQLANTLPNFMLPSLMIAVNKIPLTLQGKSDIKKLIELTCHLENTNKKAMPRNSVEIKLSEIWKKVLKLEEVGIHDNFFSAGGESIAAIQIISMSAQEGLSFSIRDVLNNPTIAELAKINNKEVRINGVHSDNKNDMHSRFELSPQQWLYFTLQNPNLHWWHQAIVMELPFYVSPQILGEVFYKIIQNHESLRLRFIQGNGQWEQFYINPTQEDVNKAIYEIELNDEFSLENEDIRAYGRMLYQTINIQQGPLMVIGLMQRPHAKSKIIWASHHLATDIVSWQILTQDLLLLLNQYQAQKPLTLPQKTTSHSFWVNKAKEYIQSEAFKTEFVQWVKQDEDLSIPSLPCDFLYSKDQDKEHYCNNLILSLGKQATKELLLNTKKFHINVILYSAFMIAYKEWCGTSRVRIYTEHHGRDNSLFPNIDVSRTVGWFVHIYPLILEAQADVLSQLISVRHCLSMVPHHGLGYLWSQYIQNKDKQIKHTPYDIFFYHVGGINNGGEYEFLLDDFAPVFAPDANRVCLLSFVTAIVDDELKMIIRYSTCSHCEDSIGVLGGHFIKAVSSINNSLLLPVLEHGGV